MKGALFVFNMPSTDDQAKTNRLCIYLIKPEYPSLKDIIDSDVLTQDIPGIGTFLYESSNRKQPSWVRDFFSDALSASIPIFTASARGMLLVAIKHGEKVVNFALTFGQGRFLLRDGVVEDRFGLRVVLNSAELQSFRSIDKTTLGSVLKHSREQVAKEATPADFGIDIEQDLVNLVSAKSRDAKFGKIITGKDAFYLSAKTDISTIKDFLAHCFARYESTDYKADFAWIDQISEVRNQNTINKLNELLLEKINMGNLEKTWMSAPEIVDWSLTKGFRYILEKRASIQDDLDIDNFLSSFQGVTLTIEHLKNSFIFSISASDEETIAKWNAFKCIYSEVEVDGKVFILNNSLWYEIARDFSDEVKQDFADTPDSTIELINYTSGNENVYNKSATTALGNACCMDQQLITHGGGHSTIEFCDILTQDKKIVHVKKYGGSSTLSHLFSQGLVSAELFAGDAEFRKKLNVKLPAGYKLASSVTRIKPEEYEIVYAVISKSRNQLDIPFFSKVSLRNAKKRLTNYGYKVTKKKILKIT